MRIIYFFRFDGQIQVCKRVQDKRGRWSNVIEVGAIPDSETRPLRAALEVIDADYAACGRGVKLIDGHTLPVLVAVDEVRRLPVATSVQAAKAMRVAA